MSSVSQYDLSNYSNLIIRDNFLFCRECGLINNHPHIPYSNDPMGGCLNFHLSRYHRHKMIGTA